uniref:Uncharacterized protein n=1 Tax=Cannabis sativa TaxID=3483 RepID=A0A803R1I6_CANSA
MIMVAVVAELLEEYYTATLARVTQSLLSSSSSSSTLTTFHGFARNFHSHSQSQHSSNSFILYF